METIPKTKMINVEECQKLIEEIYIIRSSIKEMIKKIQEKEINKATHKEIVNCQF